MESKAIARYIHQSPFKVRKTLDSVRGMNVEDALNYLHFSTEKASKIIEKTIKNLEENYSVRDKQDLLAMCCIQFAAKNLQNNSKSNDSESEVEKIILKIIDDIDKSILTS